MRRNLLLWGRTFGGSGREGGARPLVPLVLAFAMGILATAPVAACPDFLFAAAGGAVLLCCVAGILLPEFRFYPLIPAFFLAGALLAVNARTPSSQLLSLADGNNRVLVEGVVLDLPAHQGDKARFFLQVKVLLVGDAAIPVRETLRITVYRNVPPLTPGDRVRLPLRVKAFRNFQNPGAYDYESVMSARGISCAGSVSDGRRIVPMGPGDLPFPGGLVETLRRPLRRFFEKNLDPETRPYFEALVLGDRRGLRGELRKPFDRTGLGHILAVSGLHVGLVAGASFALFYALISRWYSLALRISLRRAAALFSMAPVVGYTLLTGFQVSSQRAMIMALAFLAAIILRRERDLWSTLALAALLVLAVDPLSLYTVSFQLSFGAVVGILWLAPRFLNRVSPGPGESEGAPRAARRLLGWGLGLAGICIIVNVTLLPLIMAYFHRVSLVSVPANVTVMPLLAFWVLPAGLLSAALYPFSELLAAWVLHAGAAGLSVMLAVIGFWSSFSMAAVWVFSPTRIEMVLYYVFLWSVVNIGAGRGFRVLAGAVSVALLVDAAYWVHHRYAPDTLTATFLDVGQGSAAVIRFPQGAVMVVDGGGFPGSSFDTGKMIVAPYLWQSKIRHVDYLVLTHADTDHMGGLGFLAQAFSPDEFWYNGIDVEKPLFRELKSIVEGEGIPVKTPFKGTMDRTVQGVGIRVLYPVPGSTRRPKVRQIAELNDWSLVMRLSYQGRSLLLPGDLEAQGEARVCRAACGSLASDVLLAPHHGSRSSGSPVFLGCVNPRFCVISAGYRNYFGFPHPAAVERLQRRGCTVLRIDRDGAVRCRVREGRLEVDSFRERPEP